VLDHDGVPLFAEFVILRLLESAGWRGAWIDTYRCRTLAAPAIPVELPHERQDLLEAIYDCAGSRHGCFDIFAWRDREILFAEAKRAGRDRIRESQIQWLCAARKQGVPDASFLVVEWSAD
jgi:hypothetical protein